MVLTLLLRFWREAIILMLTALLVLAVFLYHLRGQKIEQITADYTQQITEHNLQTTKHINELQSQAREREQAFAKAQAELQQKAKEKESEINRISHQLSTANDSLSELAQKAARADKHRCSAVTTATSEPVIIRVPTPKSGGELTAQMADDFARLSQGCADNYERLKTEAQQLQGWANNTYEMMGESND